MLKETKVNSVGTYKSVFILLYNYLLIAHSGVYVSCLDFTPRFHGRLNILYIVPQEIIVMNRLD